MANADNIKKNLLIPNTLTFKSYQFNNETFIIIRHGFSPMLSSLEFHPPPMDLNRSILAKSFSNRART